MSTGIKEKSTSVTFSTRFATHHCSVSKILVLLQVNHCFSQNRIMNIFSAKMSTREPCETFLSPQSRFTHLHICRDIKSVWQRVLNSTQNRIRPRVRSLWYARVISQFHVNTAWQNILEAKHDLIYASSRSCVFCWLSQTWSRLSNARVNARVAHNRACVSAWTWWRSYLR